MNRIQHLAIASQDPDKQADYYKAVFDWEEVGRIDNPRARGVILSDGAINISILYFKQDQLGHGMEFAGPHHFGVWTDNLEATAEKCIAHGGEAYSELPENEREADFRAQKGRPSRSTKFQGLEGAIFDIDDKHWLGAAPVLKAAE